MNNPYLLQNLKSQGFHYILFDNDEQKKEYSLTAPKSPDIKIPPGPAEQFKTNNPQAASNYKQKFPPLLKPEKPKKEKQELSVFEKNPLKQPILPFDKWPEDWKKIQRQCKFPPEKPKHISRQIIWTYAGLEYDLFTDNSSDKRRRLIGQIIKTLSFPRGTHIFLPYKHINAQGQSELAKEQDYSFFWSAVDLIRPRVLVVFGEQSIAELDLPPLLPTQKHTLMPVTVFALDDIMLYTENESENNIMIHFLSDNLKNFA